MLIAAAPPVRDAIFDVGGQKLHIRVLGEGGPAVVFEAGLGENMATWDSVAPQVAQFARAVLYDRAGLGQSLPLTRADVLITAAGVAASLHALLQKARLHPPYILVGHSQGGLYVQLLARRYPQEVAGVVLLDAASPDAPPELKTRARLVPGTAAYLEEAGTAASNREIEQAGAFPDVPLTVIAATDHGPFFKSWEPELLRLQHGLAKLSPRGQLVVAQGSGHDVQNNRPALVVAAIRDMVGNVIASRAEQSPSSGLPRRPAGASQ